ncbi:TRAP transporter small permease [Halovulum sp. GXIMD14794]
MTRIATFIDRVETWVCNIALGALLSCVLWGVLTRYITEKPAVWTTELSGILFTWVVFVGAASAMAHDRHIRVSLLVDVLPEGAAAWVRLLSRIIVVLFLAAVTWLSVQMMLKGASRPSPVLRIPFSWVYLASVLAFAEMTLTATLRLTGILPAPRAAQTPEVT